MLLTRPSYVQTKRKIWKFLKYLFNFNCKLLGRGWVNGGKIFIYEMTQVPSLGIFACRQSIIGHEKQALKVQNKTILLQPNLT